MGCKVVEDVNDGSCGDDTLEEAFVLRDERREYGVRDILRTANVA